LIRLPELHLEAEPTADNEFSEDGARATIPLMAAPLESGPPPDSQADVSRPDASAAVSGEPAAATGMPPAGRRLPPWSEFRVPRSALHGGLALGLVAILVIAFLAISGGSPKPGPTLADGEMAPVVTLPAASTADVLPPGLPAPPGVPAPPAPEAAAGAAASASPVKDVAKQEEAPIEDSPKATAAGGGDAQPSPGGTVESAESSAAPARTPSQPKETAPQDRTGTAAPAPGPDSSSKPNAPAGIGSGSSLTSEAPAGDAGAAGEVYSYPVTNPTTFQYPPDYHERLRPHARSMELQNAWPAPSGAGTYDRPPSTARLQPPIEPPPMR
jgi:hypothetical protein